VNALDNERTSPGAARASDSSDAVRPLQSRAAHDHLRSASPETRALIAEHETWAENFLWTDGSQVAKAARRIAALLRRHPDPTVARAQNRRQRRATRGR
jgi:hypothetical protein